MSHQGSLAAHPDEWMAMRPTQWLLLVVQFYLYGVGWLLAILLIRNMRHLLWQYSLSSLCLASGMLLCMLLSPAQLAQPVPYTGVSLVLLVGFAYAANSSLMFMRLPALSHVRLLLGCTAASVPILLLGWLEWHGWRLAVLSAESGLLVLWATWHSHPVSMREFPGLGTWLLHLAASLFGLFFLMRAVLHLLLGEGVVPELYQTNDNNLLQAVAFMVMSAIFNLTATVRIAARMARQLHQLSLHDPLTGLQNRRALHTQLTEPYLQQFRCYSVIVIDIDHFKRINDRHGHSIGDAVLARVGHILKQYSHDYCQAFRLGGEEFALILPGETQSRALALADTLRRHIASRPLTRGNCHIALTASLGVAEGQASRQRLEQVLDAADMAMYTAKQQGRNCVSAAPPLADAPAG